MWNRCDYCGQFIGLKAFADNTADRKLLTPDTAFTAETYETYHEKCRAPVCRSFDGDVWSSGFNIWLAQLGHCPGAR